MALADNKYDDDSFFDDDDGDELLQKLIMGEASVENNTVVPTQFNTSSVCSGLQNSTKPSSVDDSGVDDAMKSRLYLAEGEIAILRSQLQLFQQQKQAEIAKLQNTYFEYKNSTEEEVKTLKFSVQQLKDEKQFLDNELRTLATVKKRKISDNVPPQPVVQNASQNALDTDFKINDDNNTSIAPSVPILQPKVSTTSSDSSMFMDQLWNHCIVGSNRTSVNFLGKICVEYELKINDFVLLKKTPISSAIVNYFMDKKHLRLDELVDDFCITFVNVCMELLETKFMVSVPFLLSLIHCALSYRPVAISQSLITKLLESFTKITKDLSFLLDSNSNEEDFINYHDVPSQVMIIEKFIFICCHDILETLTLLATQYGPEFITTIWKDDALPIELIRRCLPGNSERFVNSAQVNLAYNFVEMLQYSITESTFAYNNSPQLTDSEIFSSLLKIFLIDLPIKDDFMFYGLNRILGNNTDFDKIQSIVPVDEDSFGNTMIKLPQPIPFDLLYQNQKNMTLRHTLLYNHECHLLNLRIRVATLIESYIVNKESIQTLQDKEYFKSLIRIIGFEQISILNSPRSQYVDKRIQIISKLIKIIYFITQDITDVSDLIFPETMYELFVVILRVAFSTESLSTDAHKFLTEVRTSGNLKISVFNESCEAKARELNHIDVSEKDGKLIADVESDYANGMEFPYESETVELAREILNQFVTHQEADNIYFSMNYEEDGGFDEMELVQ
jgi:DNA damage checkpoint protein LCD1